jgi:hypothetical protein
VTDLLVPGTGDNQPENKDRSVFDRVGKIKLAVPEAEIITHMMKATK